MPIELSIAELRERFPGFRVAVIVAEDLRVAEARSPELEALIAEREAACRAAWGSVELSEIPGIAAWRTAYKAFGRRRATVPRSSGSSSG